MSDITTQRVSKLEYWRDGNGAKGAEERIQDVEKYCINKVEIVDCKEYQNNIHGSVRELRKEIKKVNWQNSLITLGTAVAVIGAMIFLN